MIDEQPTMRTTYDLRQFLRDVEAGLPAWTRSVLDDAWPRLEHCAREARVDVPAAEAALKGPAATNLRQAWINELATDLHQVASGEAGPTLLDTERVILDGGLAGLTMLSLKDEQEVDEDLVLSHLTQDLEATAEPTLRDLRALCSALRGWHEVHPHAPPLHPQAVATALVRALRSQPFSPSVRLLLLKVMAPAVAAVLPPVWLVQLEQLKAAGVEPAEFKVVASPDTGFASGFATAYATGMGAWSATLPAGGVAVPLSRIHGVVHRLLAEAGYADDAQGPPSGHLSDAWMQGVVQAVVQDAAPAPRMRQVFDRLDEPGMRLARTEPDLWHQPEHVWWQLLDALMTLCEGAMGAADGVARQCEAAVDRFYTEGPPDVALCAAVLQDVQRAQGGGASRSTGPGQGGALADSEDAQVDDSPASADESDDADEDEPRFSLNRMVREQMSQQLRSTRASGSIRRFLMGPWLRVLVAALDPHEGEPALAQRYTEWVDALLSALRGTPEPDELASLLDIAREGLASIGLADGQIDTWLFDLTMRLHERGADAGEAEQASWKHDELPTVPVDLHGSVQGARARRDRVAWIRSLCVGDICRLFLDGEWCNLQLAVDPRAAGQGADAGYVFLHRGTGEELTLHRADLERLRGDGLATTVATATLVARAQDTMAARLDDALPGGKR